MWTTNDGGIEKLFQIGPKDSHIKVIIYTASINGIFKQTMNKLPLKMFGT